MRGDTNTVPQSPTEEDNSFYDEDNSFEVWTTFLIIKKKNVV